MRGATFTFSPLLRYVAISIHAPHAGSDRVLDITMRAASGISIHAPHAGSDRIMLWLRLAHDYFNPRSPCGERPSFQIIDSPLSTFQSTLPMRGATILVRHISSFPDFNPRSPCGERLKHNVCITFAVVISIHAPHAGSDSES